MAKSQETFNKKEKEKKRQKKRLDKEQKKEERKANAGNKSFEDMLAYVDENGQITSTPPDPTKKKKVVNIEDIELGAAKRESIDQGGTRTGVVTFFNTAKGYGFIKKTTPLFRIYIRFLIPEWVQNSHQCWEIGRAHV